MRILLNGQQAFAKSVLEALLEQGEEVVGVYCAPDDAGPADPLKSAAEERGLPVFQPRSFRGAEVARQMASLGADLCVMAYVTAFVPQDVLDVPRFGTIQYHPSLLPRHRGPSAINWPLIWGETRTGLTIFWPDDGYDEGPILLQKELPIGDADTVGSLYFDGLYPMGVRALLEAVALVRDGSAPRIVQDPSLATYEGRCTAEHVRVNWQMPLQTIWNLVRGANPQPGAWTTFEGRRVQLYDARKVQGRLGERPGRVVAVGEQEVRVAVPDGQLALLRVRAEGGAKIGAGQWAAEAGVKAGKRLV